MVSRVLTRICDLGFFMASLIAFHSEPKPAVLLSITGIPTFRHPFFSSSVLLTPTPIKDDEVEEFISGPAMVGSTPVHDPAVFSTSQLLPSGEKNPEYVRPPKPPTDATSDQLGRNCLYDYYLHKNAFTDLVGSVDPGFQWGSDGATTRPTTPPRSWPRTIFIQGAGDRDVAVAVTTDTAEYLGPEKAEVFLAQEQGHLFEAMSYLEDEGPGMDVIREAIRALDAKF